MPSGLRVSVKNRSLRTMRDQGTCEPEDLSVAANPHAARLGFVQYYRPSRREIDNGLVRSDLCLDGDLATCSDPLRILDSVASSRDIDVGM